MDKIVIYDYETTNSTNWGSIIEVGAVVVDKNLKEIGKLNIRGRMPEGEVPSAKALLVNSTSIDLLTKGNYSHYDFLGALENFFIKAGPCMFIGWNNTNFDRFMTQHNFFKGNRYPYITHSSPNCEHDGIHLARAAQLLNPETLIFFPLVNLILFFLFMIFILVTLTLKIFSILIFKFFLFALAGTLKITLFCSDKLVVFSVTTGDKILSYK